MKRAVLGLALTIGACTGSAATPEGVVETFMLSLHEGRCDGIGDALAGSSRRFYGPALETVCRQGLTKGKGGKQLAGMKLLDRQEQGERVTMNLQPLYADGSSGEPQRFVLAREDGAWKIDVLATGRGRFVGRFGGRQANGAASVDAAVPANTQ